MPRVLGVDTGTVSVDVCGLDDGTLCLDRSIPTTEALADPDAFVALLELGGAFSAAAAVRDGRIVDGVGGTSGPIGWRSPGALDGEVAYLAGEVTKAMLFRGGARSAAEADPSRQTLALDAFV